MNVLSNEISEGEDSVSTGYSTLPPSDVGEEDVSYVEQEEGGQGDEVRLLLTCCLEFFTILTFFFTDTVILQVQSMGPTTKNPRKRKSIGRKNKYSWKTGSHSKVS